MRIRAGVTESTAPSRRRRFAGHSVGAEVCHNLGDNMNANELADLIECACCAYQKEAGAMLRQQQAKIAEQERTIKVNRIHIRKLEMVTYWLVENRPEVWEEIRKWAEDERK